MMHLLLIVVEVGLIGRTFCSPVNQYDGRQILENPSLRPNVHLEIDEMGQCIFVKSEEGTYVVNSVGSNQICGLYIIAEPNKKVEFEFDSFDVSCVKGGLISVIDGWELNGQFFPNPAERSKTRKPFSEYCGKDLRLGKPITSSQNVALVEYRIPTKGQGFAVTVRFVDNPKPCNVILQEPQGTYTLRNYNRKVNCSVSVIFPLSIKVLAASIGVHSNWPLQSLEYETGLLSKCKKRHMRDYVEVLGGDGLDPLQMNVAGDFCGLDSMPKRGNVNVACGNTAIRLVSSGRFDNSITFNFDLLMDFDRMDLSCESFLAAFGSI